MNSTQGSDKRKWNIDGVDGKGFPQAPLSWLTEKEQMMIIAAFKEYSSQSGKEKVDVDFLYHLWTERKDFLLGLQEKLGRTIRVSDLSFVQFTEQDIKHIADTKTFVDEKGYVTFSGIQLAYLEKYKDTLDNKQLGFSAKNKRTFKTLYKKCIEENMQLYQFFVLLQEWRDKNQGLRDDQLKALDRSVATINSADVIDVVQKSSSMTAEQKRQFSVAGEVMANTLLAHHLQESLKLYTIHAREKKNTTMHEKVLEYAESFNSSHLSFEDVIMKSLRDVVGHALGNDLGHAGVDELLDAYDTNQMQAIQTLQGDEKIRAKHMVIADIVSVKNTGLGQTIKELVTHNYDIKKCSEEVQKQYFSAMKQQWKTTIPYVETKKLFTVDTGGFISSTEFDRIVDAMFDPHSKDIVVRTDNGTECRIFIDKVVAGTTMGDVDEKNPLSYFGGTLPMKFVEEGNVVCNLGSEKGLTEAVGQIAKALYHEKCTGDEQQAEAKEYATMKEDIRQKQVNDTLGSIVGKAFDNTQVIGSQEAQGNTTMFSDEGTIVDELFETPSEIDVDAGRRIPIFSPDEVFANFAKTDDEKITEGVRLLNQFAYNGDEKNGVRDRFTSLPKQQQETIKKAIIDADHYTEYNDGDSMPEGCIYSAVDKKRHEQGKIAGKPARGYFYTREQIKRKAQILKQAGLSRAQITLLLSAGIAGLSPLEEYNADMTRKIAEYTAKKNALLQELQDAKRDYRNAQDAPINGGPSLKSLQNSLQRVENAMKIQSELIKEHGKIKNDPRQRSSFSDAEKAVYEDRANELKQELEQYIAQKTQLHADIKEGEKGLHDKERNVQEIEKKVKEVDDAIENINKHKDIFKDDSQLFDWKNASQEERDAFYEKKKAEYEEKKQEATIVKKELEERLELIQDPDPKNPQREAINKELLHYRNEEEKYDKELSNIERRYRDANRAVENQRKEAQEKSHEGVFAQYYGGDGMLGYKPKELQERGLPMKGEQIFLRYNPGGNTSDGDNSESAEHRGGGRNFGETGGLWVRCEIVSVDRQTGGVKMKVYGVTGKLTEGGQDIEGKTKEFPSLDAFKNFLQQDYWNIRIKMPPHNPGQSMQSRGTALKQNVASGVYDFGSELKPWIENLVDTVDFSSMKYKNIHSGEEEIVKYMGLPISNENGNPDFMKEWFKVEYISGRNVVRVTEPLLEGRSQTRDMTYDGFLLFCADKGLQPFSQEEVDRLNVGCEKGLEYVNKGVKPGMQDSDIIRKNQKRGLFGLHWTSIKAMKGGYKKIFGAFKKKIEDRGKEDEEKLWGLMANSTWMKTLADAGIPLVSEVFDDLSAGAKAEADRNKKKTIDEYEGEVDKFKDSTPGGAFEIIEGALFKNNKARHNLLKVAGYFQYCVKKGDLYPRNLAQYRNQAMWIKLLLGEKRQQIYLEWHEKQKMLLEKDPENLDLKTRVYNGETFFLSKVVGGNTYEGAKDETIISDGKGGYKKVSDLITDEFGSIYSKAWMGGIFDLGIDSGIGAASKITSKSSDLIKKEGINFSFLYDEIYGCYKNKTLEGGLGHLEPMAHKMKKTEEYYQKWSLAMLFPLLSGQLEERMSPEAIQGPYLGLARQYGFPLPLYAWGTPNGRRELIKLLQLFEKECGGRTPSLQDALMELGENTEKNTDRLKKFEEKLKDRRGGSKMGEESDFGKRILKLMSTPKDLFALEEKIRSGSGDEQEKQNTLNVLGNYIDTKFIDQDLSNASEGGKLNAIALKKHIWSLSPGFVRYMWKRRGAQFEQSVVENVPGMWDELSQQLKEFVDKKDSLSEREVSFLLNKFNIFMDGKQINQEALIYAAFAPKEMLFQPTSGRGGAPQGDPIRGNLMNRVVLKTIDGKSIDGHNLPPQIRKNLELWIELFRSEGVRNHIGSVVKSKKVPWLSDSGRVVDKLRNSTLGPEEEAKSRFNKQFGTNKQRRYLEQQFGDADYAGYDDYDDDW